MADPYQVLGVQKTDSEAAIRSAYRKLAKRHHPDVNPGKPEAAERFKEISAAYDILSDKDKRARYDRGEIDASGNEVPPQRPYYRDFGDAAGRQVHILARQSPQRVCLNDQVYANTQSALACDEQLLAQPPPDRAGQEDVAQQLAQSE